MQLVVIGIGGAGITIADTLQSRQYVRQSLIEGALAVDSTSRKHAEQHRLNEPQNTETPLEEELPADGLSSLKHIDRKALIGDNDTHARGTQSDPFLGAEIIDYEIKTIQQHLDKINTHNADAFLIIAGLGGGTGAGGAPVLAKHLTRLYENPVYGLGILPASSREDGQKTVNAVRTFPTFVDEFDHLLLFDNDAWIRDEIPLLEDTELNQEIAGQVITLFWTDSAETTVGPDGEVRTTVDPETQLQRLLSEEPVSSIHVSSQEAGDNGLVSGLLGSEPDRIPLTEFAEPVINGRRSLSVQTEPAQEILIQIRAPPDYYSAADIEQFHQTIMELVEHEKIRISYQERDGQAITTCVLLSGLSDVPRIKELQNVAEHIGAEQLAERINQSLRTAE